MAGKVVAAGIRDVRVPVRGERDSLAWRAVTGAPMPPLPAGPERQRPVRPVPPPESRSAPSSVAGSEPLDRFVRRVLRDEEWRVGGSTAPPGTERGPGTDRGIGGVGPT